MSKASKNGTGSGGDERYTHNRRNKSTIVSSKASSSDASLPEKLAESSSRSKNSGATVKQHSGVSRSNAKSKLRSPVKSGLGQSTNRVSKPNSVSANKEVKKAITLAKSKSQMTKMKQETESSERKQKAQNAPIENKEPTEQVETIKQVAETNHVDEQPEVQQENGNTNGLNGNNVALEENPSENEAKENGQTEQHGSSEAVETNDKEEEFDLQLDAEESSAKSEDASKDSSECTKDDSQSQSKTSIEESSQEGLQVDTESGSVDVVESTTSEMSEATESSAPSEIKDKDTESQDPNAEAVSYDSSIMLKDVKIKLNDCLKDNKGEDENNADQSLTEYAHKETTFGKTLRTISGRNSIGRMRHITLRDRQPSPNSSLFVNTSSASFSEEGTPSLRYRNTLLELSSSNGTPADRKRKLLEESSSAQKKPKTEESSSLLNSSFELLKYPFGLQRPTKVSTPYKFQSDIHNVSTSEEVEADDPGTAKKWCVIM
ncbi:hypothetical protein TSAR_013408 [Trichomalopsis sarcophagae]|uniref:Uncharacterized protein n=1 Tax=Trichomalopsis sarcophagae TaxID=543379 RepID=A0A232FGJ9_9HYME|nr:hypothetical protein TSAR_013408 [Trichomalopsis sarcophagae]